MKYRIRTSCTGVCTDYKTVPILPLLVVVVMLALSGCPQLDDMETGRKQKPTEQPTEEKLADDVGDALDDLGTRLDELDDEKIDNVVDKLGSVDQTTLGTAIKEVVSGIRTELKPILPQRSQSSLRSSSRASASVQSQQGDTTPPTVDYVYVSFYTTSGSHLTCIDTLRIDVEFSEPVVVSGAPQLRLTVGASSTVAEVDGWWLAWIADEADMAYSTIPFIYTVQANAYDNDGIAYDRVDLNGGSIQDTAGNAANLSFAGATILVEGYGYDPGYDPNAPDDEMFPPRSDTVVRVDGSDQACADGLDAYLQFMVDELERTRDQVTEADYELFADDVEMALGETVTYLRESNAREFSDEIDNVLLEIDERLQQVEQREFPDQLYRIVSVVDSKHVDQLVIMIDVLQQMAERGARTIGDSDYRTQRTLLLVDEIELQLERLGSDSERKLRKILDIVTVTAPNLVKNELSHLGVRNTLEPVIDAVKGIVDVVANFIEENVL